MNMKIIGKVLLAVAFLYFVAGVWGWYNEHGVPGTMVGTCNELTKFSAKCILWEMKVVSSIKTLKNRHPDCKVVRRRGRLYVINKTNPRFKARQG